MTLVYDLWFEREYPDREDTELHIGIYETEADAAEAISRLRHQPGFKDFPEGFNVYPVPLGRTGWLEGFVTEFVPAKERNATVMSAASTDFLNVDIDLRGDIDDVAGFLKMVEPSVVVLNHIDIDASIELAEDYTSLDTTMLEIIRLIEALPPDAKKVWSRLKY
jgi:homoserine kinase type II